MKRRVAALRKRDREAVESAYHRMSPGAFDQVMSRAKRCSPSSIRLPERLVRSLKSVAKAEGETEYQTMVRRWIEERLEQESTRG